MCHDLRLLLKFLIELLIRGKGIIEAGKNAAGDLSLAPVQGFIGNSSVSIIVCCQLAILGNSNIPAVGNREEAESVSSDTKRELTTHLCSSRIRGSPPPPPFCYGTWLIRSVSTSRVYQLVRSRHHACYRQRHGKINFHLLLYVQRTG
jgi:hypothetical protein